MRDEIDNIEAMQREDTKHRVPAGWLLLLLSLLAWGIYYSASYTPEISGWSQEKQYRESVGK